jgi:hypothetical protein
LECARRVWVKRKKIQDEERGLAGETSGMLHRFLGASFHTSGIGSTFVVGSVFPFSFLCICREGLGRKIVWGLGCESVVMGVTGNCVGVRGYGFGMFFGSMSSGCGLEGWAVIERICKVIAPVSACDFTPRACVTNVFLEYEGAPGDRDHGGDTNHRVGASNRRH